MHRVNCEHLCARAVPHLLGVLYSAGGDAHAVHVRTHALCTGVHLSICSAGVHSCVNMVHTCARDTPPGITSLMALQCYFKFSECMVSCLFAFGGAAVIILNFSE